MELWTLRHPDLPCFGNSVGCLTYEQKSKVERFPACRTLGVRPLAGGPRQRYHPGTKPVSLTLADTYISAMSPASQERYCRPVEIMSCLLTARVRPT